MDLGVLEAALNGDGRSTVLASNQVLKRLRWVSEGLFYWFLFVSLCVSNCRIVVSWILSCCSCCCDSVFVVAVGRLHL